MIKPSLLDELICHNASLDSVYHKPPTAFVEGKVGLKRVLPARADGAVGEEPASQPISGKILKKNLVDYQFLFRLATSSPWIKEELLHECRTVVLSSLTSSGVA